MELSILYLIVRLAQLSRWGCYLMSAIGLFHLDLKVAAAWLIPAATSAGLEWAAFVRAYTIVTKE